MNRTLAPTTDDTALWDLWQSQFYLPVVTVADEVGTFRALSNAPHSAGELAEVLGVDARALAIHLAALCSMGLVEKRLGKWRATHVARTWLDPEATGYWGSFVRLVDSNASLRTRLLQSLKTGKRPDPEAGRTPRPQEWERGTMSPEAAHGIATFMHAHSQAGALGVAAQPEFGEIASVIDIGCGSGVYGIETARAHPHLKVLLMDLKEMAAEAAKYITSAGLSSRVTTAGVNMFTEEWPRGYDAHFFSNVFHDWSEETCALLAQRSFEALPAGGRIFLNEILMDDEGTGPWPAAAFSLLMLLGTLGKQYSLAEFRTILEAAGFSGVEAVRTGGGYYSLVTAKKP